MRRLSALLAARRYGRRTITIVRVAHVAEHLDRACRLLGGPYEGYIGGWGRG